MQLSDGVVMGILSFSGRPGWLDYTSTDFTECQHFLSSIQIYVNRILHEWDAYRNEPNLHLSTNDLEFALSLGWSPHPSLKSSLQSLHIYSTELPEGKACLKLQNV